jgi:CRP/FNR family cyclic AMP-dependent transcriptional regulator
MESIAELLEAHPFFKGLEPEYIALIAGCGVNVAFREDEFIFREGDPAEHFYIIRHGRVALETFVPGRGPLVIETISEGDVLGWSWLFPPYRWSSDARAVDVTRAVALDGVCLRGKCDADPRLGYELMRRFAQIIMDRLSATRLRLLDIYGNVPVS